ncbi:glycosyltransferase [Candidatus Saccharibacteria bacterium]|nr:glycosyltransferase [Candidatus Saccharibacteria bacterium]
MKRKKVEARPKILYTSHTANFQKFNRPLMRMMSGQGWEVHYASAGEEEILDCDETFVVDFARNPFRFDRHIKAYRQMRRILAKHKYEIIHTHTPVGGAITRLAARRARRGGTRVIYTAHGFHFYRGAPLLNWLLWYPAEKILANYCDVLITINKEDFERGKRKLKTDVRYVPGVGVDPAKFQIKMSKKERNDLRASLGLEPDDFVMIYVAEINKNKNQAGLLRQKAEMIRSDRKNHILLVGRDYSRGAVARLARSLRIANNVHFLGYRNDVPQLLKISDLYISTSKREGLGLNVIEAKVAGLRAEVSDTRGHRDIFSTKNIKTFSVELCTAEMVQIYEVGK